ncbi:hypothetical protein LYSHEL_01580 [Lysobacter helvus]|uniref:Outer membrane protein beta-barrel domain-containing protein n=2 Tax=Lysobacteraceae TaxID=32033 RepID=A0ABM7Q1P7_9GAMM|nr:MULTISPECIES: hypothetical protein [Lysobacter]BCT91134.1 hypothetical protein LYSCAS_01580 [Lysobacter caseinilyticus]BCT94287.1 hypothetical protein LYSHEL_01580 [Lysobacter helvus]
MAPNWSLRVAALTTLTLASGLAQASPSSGWDWAIAPYIWGINVKTDLDRTTPPVSISNESRFDDVLDQFDGAFQVHAEGEGDDWGLFADFTYLGLSSGDDRRFLHTETDLDTRLLEVAGVWSPGPERGRGWNLFAGGRFIDLDYTTVFIPNDPAFAPASVHVGETYTDFMLGARYTWALSDRWSITLRGDGSFGDTDGTWNASGVAQYNMSNGAWVFGYRYLDVGFKRTQDNSLSINLHGPEIGYAFRF